METDRATVLRVRAARARDAQRPRQARGDPGRAPVPARCCATPVRLTRLQRAQFRRRKTSQRFERGDRTLFGTPLTLQVAYRADAWTRYPTRVSASSRHVAWM